MEQPNQIPLSDKSVVTVSRFPAGNKGSVRIDIRRTYVNEDTGSQCFTKKGSNLSTYEWEDLKKLANTISEHAVIISLKPTLGPFTFDIGLLKTKAISVSIFPEKTGKIGFDIRETFVDPKTRMMAFSPKGIRLSFDEWAVLINNHEKIDSIISQL